jgi:hypothetical protein
MTRVTRLTLPPFSGTNEYYDVTLELSTKGISQVGGGNPGVFPHPGCGGPPTIANSERAGISGLDSTWSFTPTAGNVLLLLVLNQDGFSGSIAGLNEPTGFALLTQSTTSTAPRHDGIAVIAKTSDGTETSASWPFGAYSRTYVIELAGMDLANFASAYLRTDSADPTLIVAPAVSPPAGAATLLIGVFNRGYGGGISGACSADTGWATLFNDTNPSPGSDHPNPLIETMAISSASGSYSATANNLTGGWTNEWSLATLAVWCSGDDPPSTGQWVYNEIPTPAPDGTTTTFSTRWPFADGSLQLSADGTSQPVSSYDGVAGTFETNFAPTVGMQLWVRYQGR